MFFGLRDQLDKVPAHYADMLPREMLTTTTLGKIMPDILEELGPDRRVDLLISDFHQIFKEGLPDAQPSVIAVNDKGVLKLTHRSVVNVNVEAQEGEWQTARVLYVTTVLKVKVEVKDQQLTITLKNAEITDLMVLKNGQHES